MRLMRMKLREFRGIEKFRLDLMGRNCTILGQNGTGKTTIADAYAYLLTGKAFNGKTLEIANVQSGAKPFVTADFDDGTRLKRESGRFYFNGVAMSQRDYFAKIDEWTNGGAAVLTIPFNFCRVHFSERRKVLLDLFGGKTPDKPASFKNLTAQEVIATARDLKKSLTKQLESIPGRIEELDKQIAEVANREDPTEQLKLYDKELEQLRKQYFQQEDAVLAAQRGKSQRQAEIRNCQALIKLLTNQRDKLRKEYTAIMQGKCPYCGAQMAAKDKIDAVVAEGKRVAQELKDAQAELKALEESEVEIPRFDTTGLKAKIDQLTALQADFTTLKYKLQQAEQTRGRIDELKARQVELGEQIVEAEAWQFEAENYIAQTIAQLESNVNSAFELVQFRLFENYKVADGVKECCEPTINGVPYTACLSKGEQLMAILDIVRTFQKAYRVEMPLILDDAESYTSNSFLELPNQWIILKATEGVEKLEVKVQ